MTLHEAGLAVHTHSNSKEIEAELQSLPGRVDSAVYSATKEATELVKSRYKEEINKKTGETERTIGSIIARGVFSASGYVGSDSPVATYLEYGTRAHEITARAGGALRFVVDGREVFARRVHHPGTPAYRPLLRATDSAEPFVNEIYERAIAEALSGEGS